MRSWLLCVFSIDDDDDEKRYEIDSKRFLFERSTPLSLLSKQTLTQEVGEFLKAPYQTKMN